MESDDGERFATLAARHGSAIVVFDSPGGNLLTGLRIGSLARDRHFATAVLKGYLCASACALAWLGGSPRILEEGAQLGFHAAYVDNNSGASVSGAGSAMIGAYLRDLGLSYPTISALTEEGPDGMRWVNQQAASALGITFTTLAALASQTSRQPTVQPYTLGPISLFNFKTAIRPFVAAYFGAGSSDAQTALTFVSAHYAPEVTFYGKNVSKSDILQQKSAFVNRWPERLYLPSPNMSITCEGTVCTAAGTLDFETRSWTRGAYSAGRSTYRLVILLTDADLQIIGESGRVIERR